MANKRKKKMIFQKSRSYNDDAHATTNLGI